MFTNVIHPQHSKYVNYFHNCSTIINIHRKLFVVNFIGQMNP